MSFSLPDRWPLVPLDVAAFYLNRPPEAVARDCDSLWAWDISSGGAHRRQLRIWRDSLVAIKNPELRRTIPTRLDQVIDSFLPRRDLRGSELQRLLFCGRNLIRNLEEAHLLEVECERRSCGGSAASRVYSHASIKRFLTDRSLGGILTAEDTDRSAEHCSASFERPARPASPGCPRLI